MARKTENLEKINKQISVNLKKFRSLNHLSRKKIANNIDVSHQQLSKYENNTNVISAARLYVLCKKYNLDIYNFFKE